MKLNTLRVRTLQDLRDFTTGNGSFDLEPVSRSEAYRFIETTLKGFRYPSLNKADKGALKAYLGKATGRSRAQLTRLIAQCRETGAVRDRRGTPGKPYRCRYTPEDVALLAETDRLHEGLSGPAIRHICQRQHQEFGDERYQRLALISIGHLYNLRRDPAYLRQNRRIQSTQSVKGSAIGERRCPQPDDRPGFLRIDTVHQGDLRDLQVEFTRSRARHSNDNGLVESKNAAVVRKQFGYGHIPVGFYEDINRFTAGVLAEHLNFHRPCWFPQLKADHKGRIVRQYHPEDLRTPYERFCSLPNAGTYLRPDVTLAQLQAQARCRSDNESAERLLRERRKLFKPILESLRSAA